MRQIDPEILANRAALEMELEERRAAREVPVSRWIFRGFLAVVLVIMVCNLFV